MELKQLIEKINLVDAEKCSLIVIERDLSEWFKVKSDFADEAELIEFVKNTVGFCFDGSNNENFFWLYYPETDSYKVYIKTGTKKLKSHLKLDKKFKYVVY